jgi:hypothetical protein
LPRVLIARAYWQSAPRIPIRRTILAFLGVCAAAGLAAAPPAAATGGAPGACPTRTDARDFASKDQLRKWVRVVDGQLRATGGRNHVRFVNWLERRLDSIPSVKVSSVPFRFDRQEERSASLRVRLGGADRALAPAGAVPYSRPTRARGVSAPLLYLPNDADISAAKAAGRIVVRELVAGSLPNAAFNFVTWSIFDPEATFRREGVYKRDWLSPQATDDMRAADAAGAAGLLFVHEFPRAEISGHYRPYDGIHWKTPALHLGIDEGERIKRAIAAGTAGRARIAVRAKLERRATTRMLIARLAGPGKRRVVVTTHTDGTNALEDNGHSPILAIARYFATLPRKCRPGPMEFAFTTAHFYQRLGDATGLTVLDQYAQRLDRAYDRGEVALALVLEHLGAREWEAVPRGEGRPGLTLRRTGLSEPSTTFVTESPFLVGTLEDVIRERDVRRSLLLKGTSLPDNSRVPPYCSFGGEGNGYLRHLMPTVAFITAPWPLFAPGYSMNQLMDFGLLRRQSLMWGDFLLRLRGASQRAIAGEYTRYRAERAAGKPTC